MKILSLNTYAGSLLLGASALPDAEIIGSYEDKGFGQDIARANFEHIDHRPTYKDWPAQDLSDVIVIAHPPCSAFSVQNCSPTARGVGSAAFSCTKKVLEYATENKARAIAIESVMGALGGAWHEHQRFADEYGYHIYRILENGVMWGCQWRERFWVLYVKKEASPWRNITLRLRPNFKTVREVVKGWEDGPSAGNQEKLLGEQKKRLIEDAKLTPEEMAYFFEPQNPPHPTKALGTLLYEKKFKTPESTSFDKWDVFQKYIGGFASGTMVYLDPNGWAPVLMGGSFWYYNGRTVSENAFKRIMGFPGDYVFPETPRNTRSQMRMYLSKGVIPPIAQWILEEVGAHLELRERRRHTEGESYEIICEPNHIADFRISKDAWKERNVQLPPLRLDDVPPHVKEERRNAPRPAGRRVTPRQAAMDGRMWVSGKPTMCLNADCNMALPESAEVREEPSMGVIVGEVTCPTCGKTTLYSRKVDRPVRDKAVRAHRVDSVRVTTTDIAFTDTSLTGQKRRIILAQARELGNPTHLELITACLQHPQLQILPTTMNWHVRQLVKFGFLKENV